MLTIEPVGLHWMEGSAQRADLCAHGGVVLRWGTEVLVDQRGASWTLSAAALYLLRTVERDHTPEAPVGSQLFPCCGHAMFPAPGPEGVWICGCGVGYDFEVRHLDGSVQLSIEGREHDLPEAIWCVAVLAFSDAVEAFYDRSEEKQPSGQEAAEGLTAFRSEWRRLRALAEARQL